MKNVKEILKEEIAISGDKLKEKGIELGKEALETVALEMSDMMARVAVKTENKMDDLYLTVKGMVDAKLDDINPSDNE
jgi:hypothetical protein